MEYKYFKYRENNVVYYYRIKEHTPDCYTILRLSKDLEYPEDLYRTYKYTAHSPLNKSFTNEMSITAEEFKKAVEEMSNYLLNSTL